MQNVRIIFFIIWAFRHGGSIIPTIVPKNPIR